jgi:hypothetical protein
MGEGLYKEKYGEAPAIGGIGATGGMSYIKNYNIFY